ncbi:MAG TPA: MFS transporter [Anaerolineaceae bacterium]|nr:MFS transporter [Anaerolineaceae bacterium]
MGVSSTVVNEKREIFGWAMYDWANSAFSTTVVTVFLGPYLTAITKASADPNGLVYLFGVPIRYDSFFTYCISASVLLQVTFLPILGALADYSHLRKSLMQLFCILGSAATILMFFILPGGYWLGGFLFIIANLAFGASIVFYNSYLPSIASEDQRDRVSAYGWAMGYLGGGLLLVLNLVLYLFSGKIGLDSGLVARISLVSAGVWWLGFSFITFARLHTRHAVRPLPTGETYLSIGFKQLASLIGLPSSTVTTLMLLPLVIPVLILLRLPVWMAILPGLGPIAVMFIFIIRKSRTLPEAMKFLVAYIFYNDGIQTVIAVSAIFAAEELNFSSTNLILVILMIQFVAFLGALGFGRLANWIGAKRAILVSLVIWSGTVIYAFAGMKSTALVLGMEERQLEFWVLGFIIALVLGGSQAISRSLFAQMIPKDQEAEFYSFYEISERGTSWMGTFLFGLVNQLFGSLRIGIVSVIFFFLIGLILLPMVNVERSKNQRKMEDETRRGSSPATAPALEV